MEIGETLKLIRINNGLSQKEFSKDVLSSSYYSKVELGDSHISADLLFTLLEKVNITLSEFCFISNDYNGESQITLLDEIKHCVHEFDLEGLKCIYQKFDESTNIHYQIIVRNLINYLSYKETINEENQILKKYLLDVPTWGHYEFQLFYLCTQFMPLDILLVLSIHLARNMSTYERFPGYEQDLLMVLVNLTRVCIKEDDIEEGIYFLQLAKKINKTHAYTNEQLLLFFYEGILLANWREVERERGIEQAKRVIGVFEFLGRTLVSKRLTTFLERYLKDSEHSYQI